MTGAVLAGLPYAWHRRLSVALLLDSVAPGLALGIAIGRIGDLIIGEHLGGRTDFFLGWRCSGAVGDPDAPYPWPGPTLQGCFDVPVHQTALYDFLAAGIVFAVLLLAERKPRFDGFFTAAFVVLYGAGRFLTDFARAADKDLIGTLTGSQVTVLLAVAATLLWVIISRPQQRPSWAWTPPRALTTAGCPATSPARRPLWAPDGHRGDRPGVFSAGVAESFAFELGVTPHPTPVTVRSRIAALAHRLLPPGKC